MEKKFIRLQLFVAKCGACSRRKAAEVIKKGRVRVNNKEVLAPFYKVNKDSDSVSLDDQKLVLKDKIYLMLNKPKGFTTTRRDPFSKNKVMDLLPKEFKHLHPVGRLDKDTSGLLLFTNDGELTFKLTHPKFGVEKTYLVNLDKQFKKKHFGKIQFGLLLEEGKTLPCKVKTLSHKKLEITIREGRKRQVKRMFSKLGYKVLDLTRVREGFLKLGNLAEGKFRLLSKKEMKKIYSRLGL